MNACCDRDKVPVENSLCPATIITISPSPLLQNIKPLFIGRVLRLKSTDWEETYYFPWETKSREKAFASLWEITRRGGTLHPARPHDCQCMKLSSSGFPFVVVCVGGTIHSIDACRGNKLTFYQASMLQIHASHPPNPHPEIRRRFMPNSLRFGGFSITSSCSFMISKPFFKIDWILTTFPLAGTSSCAR